MDLRCLLDCLYSKNDLVSISLNMKGVPFVLLVGFCFGCPFGVTLESACVEFSEFQSGYC